MYTSGRLLLEEHWISRKWCQYLFALIFLTLVIKRNLYFSLFPDCLRLISLNLFRKFYQSFSGTWVLSASWTLTNIKKQLFQENFISSLFSSCLMLKVFKLQIISDRNVNKISHKYYLKLSQDNPSRKSSLKVESITFVLVCFVCLKERTCETRRNVFYFTSKALFVLEIIKF